MLLARRSSDKGWGNILFIVFLAIFWVIGGILKAKKNALEKTAGGQGLGQKPGVKPPEGNKETPKGPFQQIRAVVVAELEKQRELQTQDKQRKVVHPKPAVRKIVTRPERVKESYNLETLEEIRLPSAIAEVEPKLDKLPEYTSKTVHAVGAKRTGATGEVLQARHLSEILSDYSDPDELKKAILHYEILGRPLSLRDPSGRIIGL